jgi:hypothetical protein
LVHTFNVEAAAIDPHSIFRIVIRKCSGGISPPAPRSVANSNVNCRCSWYNILYGRISPSPAIFDATIFLAAPRLSTLSSSPAFMGSGDLGDWGMTDFGVPAIQYLDTVTGRAVTVTLKKNHWPSAIVSFIDEERPDETNAEERARIIAQAQTLMQEAADALLLHGAQGVASQPSATGRSERSSAGARSS